MIEQHLQNIEKEIEAIRRETNPYARITDAYWQDGKITVEYDTNVDIDIRYWFGDKIHNVEDYIDEIDQSEGRFEIGVNQFDKDWNVQVFGENVESELWNVGAYREEFEKLDIFTAFWGSNGIPDETPIKRKATAGIHKAPTYKKLKQIHDYGHKIIGYIGLEKETDQSEYEIRKKVSQRHEKFLQIGYDNFECIILDDEPFRSGYTTEQLEWMVDEAQKLYEVPVTFMFMEYHLKRQELPKNLKLVGVNLYPLKKEGAAEGHTQAWDYSEFKEITDSAFANAYDQLEDPRFVITVQAFGTRDGSSGPQWRMPSKEELEWYFMYASENPDVVGLTFWKWNSEPNSKYEGISTRPELQQALEELLIKYTISE